MARILLLTILILILFFPRVSFAHSSVQVVEMNVNGFKPETVTIDQNSTVIFVNKDTKARWPASNSHPIHDLYSDFDPRQVVKSGDSWTFKPKKIGTWKFHDHLFPHMRGTLIVTEEEKKDIDVKVEQPVEENQEANIQIESWLEKVKAVFNQLLGYFKGLFAKSPEKKELPLKENFTKMEPNKQIEVLQDVARSGNTEAVWSFIKSTFTGQGGSNGNIHDLAHLSGNLIFQYKGFEGLVSCSTEFAFGCYHGFLDKAFEKSLDRLKDAQDACLKLGSGSSGPVASCIHGIGHGVASYYSFTDLKGALATCRKLTSGKEFCFDGVFMEFVRSAPEKFFQKDNPLYPCDDLEDKYGYAYSIACGRNQPALLMGRFNKGFDEVVNICLESTSTPFKQACFDALGLSLASSGKVKDIINGCQKINEPSFAQRCLKQAAGELVFQEVLGWQGKSKQVCNVLTEGKDECLQYVDRLVQEYNRK